MEKSVLFRFTEIKVRRPVEQKIKLPSPYPLAYLASSNYRTLQSDK